MNNLGPDGGPTVVSRRLLTFQTDNEPPGAGPKNFDYEFWFDQPFEYDPASGDNLLLQFDAYARGSQVGNWFIDAQTTSGRISTVTSNGSMLNMVWPAQFTFEEVPEPSTLVLAALGLLAGLSWGWWRRRQRPV